MGLRCALITSFVVRSVITSIDMQAEGCTDWEHLDAVESYMRALTRD